MSAYYLVSKSADEVLQDHLIVHDGELWHVDVVGSYNERRKFFEIRRLTDSFSDELTLLNQELVMVALPHSCSTSRPIQECLAY